jgi:hypothetical protein
MANQEIILRLTRDKRGTIGTLRNESYSGKAPTQTHLIRAEPALGTE